MDKSILVYVVKKSFTAVITSGHGTGLLPQQGRDNDVGAVDYDMWSGVGFSINKVAATTAIPKSDCQCNRWINYRKQYDNKKKMSHSILHNQCSVVTCVMKFGNRYHMVLQVLL